ncbi:MAG: hypothetical protein WC928_03755 [Patescibacteria group bacterium]|jgi:hypothetical protein
MDNIKNILKNKTAGKKPPAHQWQDLALRIIKELSIPDFKRNSVFKICKDNPETRIMQSLNDTKELCKTGQKWQYFFKIINPKK